MLDYRCDLLLDLINKECSSGYTVLETEEILSRLPLKAAIDRDVFNDCLKELSDRELISVKYRDDKEICLSPLPKGRLVFENKTENERKEKEIKNALFKKAFIGGVSGGITGSVIYALISLIIKGA